MPCGEGCPGARPSASRQVGALAGLGRAAGASGAPPAPALWCCLTACAGPGCCCVHRPGLLSRLLGPAAMPSHLSRPSHPTPAGEQMVGPKRVVFADEISTGLDSSTTYQIIKWMRDTCHTQLDTMLVALLQPCAPWISMHMCARSGPARAGRAAVHAAAGLARPAAASACQPRSACRGAASLSAAGSWLQCALACPPRRRAPAGRPRPLSCSTTCCCWPRAMSSSTAPWGACWTTLRPWALPALSARAWPTSCRKWSPRTTRRCAVLRCAAPGWGARVRPVGPGAEHRRRRSEGQSQSCAARAAPAWPSMAR